MAPKYPTASEIESIFKNMETGNFGATFEKVSPKVHWTVMGTHPLAGVYTSREEFQKGTLSRLGAIMKEPGIRLKVRQVIGGGPESPWATVELVADAACKNDYKFENTYAWVVRFDESGKIDLVRAYLDSNMVKEALEQNEAGPVKSSRAPVSL